jgi:pimeloyl-ACP methyl ester carboxylesterase
MNIIAYFATIFFGYTLLANAEIFERSRAIEFGKKLAGKDCANYITSLDEKISVGWVKVLENPNIESSEQSLYVFFYGHINSSKPFVIYLNGGPGTSSWGIKKSFSRNDQLAKEFSHFSFIFMDQRGTGCSTPLHLSPSLASVERLANYGPRQIVSDAEVIRNFLIGPQKWHVVGSSFGSITIPYYLSYYPEGLLSAHSLVGHVMDSPRDMQHWTETMTIAQIERLKHFFIERPTLETKLKTTLSLMPEDFCVEREQNSVCGRRIFSMFWNILGFARTAESYEKNLDRFTTSDGTPQFELLKNTVFEMMDFSSPEYPLTEVIYRLHMSDGTGERKNLLRLKTLLPPLGYEEEFIDLTQQSFFALFSSQQWHSAIDDYVQSHPVPSDRDLFKNISKNLTLYPTLDYFMYAGELDFVFPPAVFERSREEFGAYANFHFSILKNTTHVGISKEVFENLIIKTSN